jgi:hypothetical protein
MIPERHQTPIGSRVPKKPDGFEMFCFASLYQEGASAVQDFSLSNQVVTNKSTGMLEQNSHMRSLIIPSSILLVLSFEVYLKCLKRVRGRKLVYGHDTRKLFSALSQSDQRLLARRFKEFGKEGVGFRGMSLNSILDRTASYFIDMRYGYEKPIPRMPTDGEVTGIFGLSRAVHAVRSVILDKHPDWHQRYMEMESFH